MAARIALLGPLTIDGNDALGPRDRVVLATLATHPGEILSAESLADALWAEQLPASWNKVVAGCVMRLRRTLGAGAIETTPRGYRLATRADDIDTQRFERLVERGHQLLALSEPDRAANALGDALALWRGRPLIEAEGWEPARIEAMRLDELRLDAQEALIDACLQSGRHREVLADAQARVAEAPLRERRWALLARALYQAGRQGEALRALQRARSLLVGELGIDPGPELVTLEGAILRQDPALVAATAVEPSAVCPYRGLLAFGLTDADNFFGREEEVDACLRRIAETNTLVVVGPSGSGKSSLVRAGLAAALQREGNRVTVLLPGIHPMDPLSSFRAHVNAVLVVDQCEEALTQCTDSAERSVFFATLADLAERSTVVVALRADHLGAISAFPAFARLVERGVYLLGPMSGADLQAAIEGPARQAGLLLEPGLVDALVRDVEGEPGALPLLSHALRQSWERREGRTITVAGYRATGGIRGAVAQSAEQIYNDTPIDQRLLLRDLLLRLVSLGPDGEPARRRVLRRNLASDVNHEQLIERLVSARLATSDNDAVELAHEALARAWPRFRGWLDDDVDGQRIFGHLTAAADAWAAMGRPDSELYRGIRLSQVVEWRDRTQAELTPTERDFLEAARRASERERRHRLASRRRRRTVVVGTAALVVGALVAGALAVDQRQRAQTAAVVADARRASALSLDAEGTVEALLLATAAMQLDDSPETRASLLAALTRSPPLIGSLETVWPPSVAVSPGGGVIAAGGGLYDAATLEPRGRLEFAPRAVQFRADGEQLAVALNMVVGMGQREFINPPIQLLDADTYEPESVQLGGLPSGQIETWDLDYSHDGRFLAVSLDEYEGDQFESTVMVFDLAAPEQPVQTIDAGQLWALALSADGRTVYVGDHDPELTAYDVATGRPTGTIALGPEFVIGSALADDAADALEVSPDGTTVAIVDGHDIVLLDAVTLEETRRLRGHTDVVRSVQFSPDSTRLASGSDDRTAMVWDLDTGRRFELLEGHQRGVRRAAFSPDGATLYTSDAEETLVWDLRGDRRFMVRAEAFGPGGLGSLVLAAPDGEAVAHLSATWPLQAPSTDHIVRFLDVATGRVGRPISVDGGTWSPAWQPGDAERLAIASPGGTVRVLDWRRGTVVAERSVLPAEIAGWGLTYSADGGQILVAARSGSVVEIDATTLEPVGPIAELGDPVQQILGSAGRTAIAILESGGYAKVDLDAGRVIDEGELGSVPSFVDLSPDGRRLGVTDPQGRVGVFDLESRTWLHPLTPAHESFGYRVDFSADGSLMVTSGWDGRVIVWDSTKGEPFASVALGSSSAPMVGVFLEDGHTVIAGGADGRVHRWDTRPGHWAEFACLVVGRNLRPDEWLDAFGNRVYENTCPD